MGEGLSLGQLQRREDVALLVLAVIGLLFEELFGQLVDLLVIRSFDGFAKGTYGVLCVLHGSIYNYSNRISTSIISIEV